VKAQVLKSLRDQLQRQRRTLVGEIENNEAAFQSITETAREELEERAQREGESQVLEPLDQTAQRRISDIDAALARMNVGSFGRCDNCRGTIPLGRLRADPTIRLCPPCSEKASRHEPKSEASDNENDRMPARGELPSDLAVLDDEELQEHLGELIREDKRIETQELQIGAQNGIIYLEGALPSEPERQILLNVLTDVAGIRDIVDHLEIQPLAWQRSDRSKPEEARATAPQNHPDHEPYGGTEDVTLSQEEGVDYEPPQNPPPPQK
jgi:DnaK suppressor protein